MSHLDSGLTEAVFVAMARATGLQALSFGSYSLVGAMRNCLYIFSTLFNAREVVQSL